jgi:SAM-dependent methyltransferase
MDSERSDIEAYYARAGEVDRLTHDARGALESERTKEIIGRRLPPPPAVVADIGGGPGHYALWLAGLGYSVEHRDLMPLHVGQVKAARGDGESVRTEVGDARELDLADASVDAVLLLGPLYHLRQRVGRVSALREAARIAKPGAPVFGAAISRWAPRLDGLLRARLYEKFPEVRQDATNIERSGYGRPLFHGAFTAYYHRPGQLRREVAEAGLDVTDLVSVEGAAYLLADLDDRLAGAEDWEVVFDCARATERVPELIGIGPHLIVTAVRVGP